MCCFHMNANLGGNDNVSAFVVPWFLGEATPGMVDNMTGAMCTSTYRSDVNLDWVFDEKDTVADKNLFCLTSSASFSNGNYVSCAFKASGMVTLLGRTTAGGACTVLPNKHKAHKPMEILQLFHQKRRNNMTITTFNPQIVTKGPEPVIKLF